MKPLEAVGYGKRVLLTDVAPLLDMKSVWPSFEYFAKGNLDSLTERIEKLLNELKQHLLSRQSLENLIWERAIAPVFSCIKNNCRN